MQGMQQHLKWHRPKEKITLCHRYAGYGHKTNTIVFIIHSATTQDNFTPLALLLLKFALLAVLFIMHLFHTAHSAGKVENK